MLKTFKNDSEAKAREFLIVPIAFLCFIVILAFVLNCSLSLTAFTPQNVQAAIHLKVVRSIYLFGVGPTQDFELWREQGNPFSWLLHLFIFILRKPELWKF